MTPSAPTPRLSPAKAIFAIALLGWIAYANSLTKAFQLDDFIWITNNPTLHDFWANLRDHAQRPMAAITLNINYHLGGFFRPGYRMLNVGIHIAAAVTLFGLVRRTLLRPRFDGRFDRSATGLALAVAAIWIVHPLNTHAVTYIIQRCESGMGLGFVLTLYCLVRGAESKRPAFWHVAAPAAAWMGAGFKEVIIALIPVALLYDRLFLATSWADVLRKRWYVHLGIASILLLPFRAHFVNLFAPAPVSDTSSGFNIPGLGPITYFATELGVLTHYLRLAVWPVGLCFDYHDWPIAQNLTEHLDSGIFLTVVFLACLVGVARGNGLAFLGLATFFVLSVTSSFLPIRDVANEYRMYVPMMFLTTLAVVGGYLSLQAVWPAGAERPLVGAAIVVPIVVLFTVGTILRNEDYQTVTTLWTDVIEKRPGNPRAPAHLGFGASLDGDFDKVEHWFERSLELNPHDHATILQLALVRFRKGDLPGALEYLERTRGTIDFLIDAQSPFGTFLHFNGQSDQGLEMLNLAVRVHPTRTRPRFLRAGVLVELGRTQDAQADIDECNRLNPEWVDRAEWEAVSRLRGNQGTADTVRREALFFARLYHAARPSTESLEILSDAQAWTGDTTAADETLRRAIAAESSPENRERLERKLRQR